MLIKRAIWWTGFGLVVAVPITLWLLQLLGKGFVEVSAMIIGAVAPYPHAGP